MNPSAQATHTERTVSTALHALEKAREEVRTRVGQPGGNLNERVVGYLDTVEVALLQVQGLGDMLKILNNQAELAVSQYRSIMRVAQLPAASIGDDGTS